MNATPISLFLAALLCSACVADAAPNNTEDNNAVCDDGLDNDGDDFIDCADRSCSWNANVTVCGTESNDALCDDGLDNDGNGHTDCDDFACSRNATVTVCDTAPNCTDTPDADEPNPGPVRASSTFLGEIPTDGSVVTTSQANFYPQDDVDTYAWNGDWQHERQFICRITEASPDLRVHMRLLFEDQHDGIVVDLTSESPLANDEAYSMYLGPNIPEVKGTFIVSVSPETLDSCNNAYVVNCRFADQPSWE